MNIKTLLTCAGALLLGGLRAQCFTLSDNVNGQICLGASAQLSATPASTCGAMTFSWYPWGHVGTNYVITPTVTTVYTVIASSSATLTGTIVVNPLPNIALSANPAMIVCSSTFNTSTITASGANSYSTMPNNVFTWPTIYVMPVVSTVYTVSGTDINGCVNSGTVLVKYDNSMCPCSGCGGSIPPVVAGGSFSGPICVNTDITITGPVNIVNADLTIGTGVKITIAPGGDLYIDNSHLSACNNMWQGMVIKPGGKLKINKSLIEDALEAIDITNHITPSFILAVDQTTFNRNNIAIDIENYTAQIPSYPFSISNCLFTCRDIKTSPMSFPQVLSIAAPAGNPEAPLSNSYIDNSLYQQTTPNAYLKFPHAGTKPDAGIRLRNVGITLNPNSGSTVFYEWALGSGSQLFFDNLDAGMELYNANASVYNSVFQNSDVGIRCEASNNSHNSLRVNSQGGLPNQFVDCKNGIIDRWYYNLDVSGADFRTTWGAASGMTFPPNAIDVWTNRYRDCRIEDNTIYNMSQGIGITAISNVPLFMPGIYNGGYWGQYAGSMYINRNKMDANVPGNPTTYQRLVTGINMQMYASQWYLYLADPATQIVQVDKNEIINTEVGIYMSQWKWLNQSCNSNKIQLVPPAYYYSTPTPNFGICNTISEGTPSQPLQVANNIVVGYGTSNPDCSGILFGPGAYTDLTCNYVSNVTNGYNINFVNPNITFRNNEMNSDKYGFVLNNGGDIGQQGSLANPQDNTWSGIWPSSTYKTAVFGGANAANSKFYIRSSTSGPYNPNGSSISTTPPVSNTDYAISNGNLVVSTSAPPLAFCPIVPSSARMAQGGAVNTDQLKVFASRKPDADPAVEFNRRTHLYGLAAGIGYRAAGSDTLSEFYRAQESGNVGLFAKIEKAFASRSLAEAVQMNESVMPANKAEENTKLYYRTALRYFNGSFNNNDSVNLCRLVLKCPYTDGLVVLKARVLYNLRFGWRVFADACATVPAEHTTGIARGLHASSVQLYPNPSSGEVNVLVPDFGDESIEITVCDISGRCVYKKMHQLQGGKTLFMLDYAAGAYLVTLNSAELNANMKLIIQK